MSRTRLYFRLLGLHLRALMEYEHDFVLMAVATLLTQAVNVTFLMAVFARVPNLNGWSFWAVLAMFGLMAVAEGVGSLLFEGTWRLAEAINQGTLDYMIVRPYPVALQITSVEVGINGLTNILTGCAMLTAAFSHLGGGWSMGRVSFAVVLLISAIAIKVAINLATNCISFWLSSPSPLFAMAVHQIGEMARFPITIYPAALKGLMSVVVPFAFVSTFPVSFLWNSGPQPWVGVLTPLVALYCVALAFLIFRSGLRRYESAGN